MYPHPPVTSTVRIAGDGDANAVATRLVINVHVPKIPKAQFVLPCISMSPGAASGRDSYAYLLE
jgi:hypothetical protein